MHCRWRVAKQSGVQTVVLTATSHHLLHRHKLSRCLDLLCISFPLIAYGASCRFRSVMQGAFILVGNNSFGYPLLVVMAVGVLIYACWRFWEGITGQGSDDAFGPFKNFFRYRLSPLVSVKTRPPGFCPACMSVKWVWYQSVIRSAALTWNCPFTSQNTSYLC